jgi:hypothetical protein
VALEPPAACGMAPAQPAPSGRANRVNQAAQYALFLGSPMMR